MTVTFGYTTTADGARICYVTEPGTGTPTLHVYQSIYPCVSACINYPSEMKLSRGLAGDGAWYRFDWRASGKSSAPVGPITFEQLVCDIDAVSSVIGVPFDMTVANDACAAAVSFAARRPEMVRRLLLVSPIGEKTQAKESFQRSIQASQADMVYNVSNFLKWAHPGTDEEEMFRLAKAGVAAKPPEVAFRLRAALSTPDLLEVGAAASVPAFILHTEVETEDALDLAAAMPNARAVNWTTIGDGTINGAAWRKAWDEAIPPAPSTRPAASAQSFNGVLPTNGAAQLSARELEVLRLLAVGTSNKAIAETLSVSLPTVATHVRHILEKTASANRTEAATWALKNEVL